MDIDNLKANHFSSKITYTKLQATYEEKERKQYLAEI